MTKLTNPMQHALAYAARNGGYLFAGTTEEHGKVVRINARTIDALVARGMATRCFSSEGGMGCRVTTTR